MVPRTGPFRWGSVTCPKGYFLVTSVAVSILVYLHVVTVLLWEDLEGRHLTSHLSYLRLLSFSFPVQRWTGICLFAFLEISMILLAEPGPLPQLQAVSRVSKSPRKGRLEYRLYLCHLNVHDNTMTQILLFLSFYRWEDWVTEYLITFPNHTAIKH